MVHTTKIGISGLAQLAATERQPSATERTAPATEGKKRTDRQTDVCCTCDCGQGLAVLSKVVCFRVYEKIVLMPKLLVNSLIRVSENPSTITGRSTLARE